MNDDDLTPSPLWDALRAPGTDEELAGEAAALAAFRAARPARGRGARRLGVVGGAGLAIFVAAGAGVAAALTGHLPQPLQDAVHDAVPGVPQHHSVPRPQAAPHRVVAVPTRSSSAARTPAPTPAPSFAPTALPVATPQVTPQPAVSTTPAPAVSATSEPSATSAQTPAPAPTLTVALSATTVSVHQDVLVSGRLVRGGKAMAGRAVYLARQYPGQTGWTRIGQGTTDSDGRVQLTAQDLTRNVALRLGAAGVTSGSHKVTVRPAVAVRVTVPAAGQRKLNVTTDGAVAGDTCQLMRLDGTTWTPVASHRLDANAATAFTVPAAPSGSKVRYRVRVLATGRHGWGQHIQTLSSP